MDGALFNNLIHFIISIINTSITHKHINYNKQKKSTKYKMICRSWIIYYIN